MDAGGDPVSYDQLIERVWGDSDVTLHTIIQTANDLKRALEEFSDCVQNIPGVGYSFRKPLSRNTNTPNPEGLDLETLTRHAVGLDESRLRTEASLRRALEHFRYVTEQCPQFVEALLAKADCLIVLGHTGYQTFSPVQILEEAYGAARAALKLALNDKALAAALATLGKIELIFEWDLAGAEAKYRRALSLDSECVAAFHGLAHVFLFSGRWPESLQAIDEARRLSPNSPMIHGTAGWLRYFMGHFDDAIRHGEKTVGFHNRFPPGQVMLGVSYQAVGEHLKAVRSFEAAYALEPSPVALSCLGHVLAVTGRISKAKSCLNRLDGMRRSRFVSSWCNALIHTGLGDAEKAISSLREAADERCDWLLHLGMEPRWDSLKGLSAFSALVERVRRTKRVEQR